MNQYQCPLCHKTMPRDLAVYLNHTHQHVIDKIKETHPDWVEQDGACQPCADYYGLALVGEAGAMNIGPKEKRKRWVLGWFFLALSILGGAWLVRSDAGIFLRLFLFIPLFVSAFGFYQACMATCAMLALSGQRNMDTGRIRIEDNEIAEVLRRRGLRILVSAFLTAAVFTFIFCLV